MAANEHHYFLLFIDCLQEDLIDQHFPYSNLYQQCFEIVQEVNALLDEYECEWQEKLDPLKSTVMFGSSKNGWAFDLDRFGRMYAEKFGMEVRF